MTFIRGRIALYKSRRFLNRREYTAARPPTRLSQLNNSDSNKMVDNDFQGTKNWLFAVWTRANDVVFSAIYHYRVLGEERVVLILLAFG